MYGFTIVENLQKIDQDIKRHELKYHKKTRNGQQRIHI